jgi:thiol:disulfide interchange protein
MKCSCSLRNVIWPLAVLALAIGVISFLSRTAPTPPVFQQGLTLSAARQQSEETGKPILALATADWCAPCQSLKRGALTNDRVAATIRERTIPVYLDATSPESSGAADAASLGVTALPTMLIISQGEVVAVQTGDQSADALLAWIDGATGGA